jgi:hypothetical protein
MAVIPVCGGTGTVQSPNVNAERSVNWMPFAAPGTPKQKLWMPGTPSVRPFVVLDNGPIRALFSQDGRTFAVGGTSFYELFSNQTVALRGSTALDGRPATISSNGTNGNQLFITSGGRGYIYDLALNTITLITDADFPTPVEMGWFSDGYFGALKRGTNAFQTSNLFDGLVWDALDSYSISTTPDLVVAQAVLRREVYTAGSLWTSVWQDTGQTTIYQPVPGVSAEVGCAAPYSFIVVDNAVYFLGQNRDGGRMVFRFNGYQPERVSNDAIDFRLGTHPQVADAIAYSYQEAGHTFYVLYLPTPPDDPRFGHVTLVYDVAMNLWHERALTDAQTAQFVPDIGRCHCYAWGKHLIGARDSAAIYDQSMLFEYDVLVR